MTMSVAEYEAMVNRPGKFEAEERWVPYFWERLLDGDGEDLFDEDEDVRYAVSVDEADRALFPELANVARVTVWEDDNGFVFGSLN